MNIIAANFKFTPTKPAALISLVLLSAKSRFGTIVSKNILYKPVKNMEAFTTMYMIIQNLVRANSKKFNLNVFIDFSPWIMCFVKYFCYFAQKYFTYIISCCLIFVNKNFYLSLAASLEKGGADCINYFSREASIFSTALQVGLPHPAYTSAA